MSMNNPAGAPATGASGSQPGATQPTGPQSQGPNDPIQPPATGSGTQPATGAPGTGQQDPNDARITNLEAAMRRMGEERDTARQELEAERRKGLKPEELERLRALDEKDKQRDQREKSLILRYEIAARAPKLGIVDPEVAVVLLERSSKVTVADDGAVTGVDEALKELIKEKPFLVKATSAPADAGAGAGGERTGNKVSMNDIIRRGARGVTIREG